MDPITAKLMSAAGGAAVESIYVDDVFSTDLYDGASQTATEINNGIDLAGEGGLVWIKCRSHAANHHLFDTERGALVFVGSESTNAEQDGPSLGSFDSDGYTHSGESNNTNLDINENGRTFCSWTFRKCPGFFDVVTYTGTGSNQNISHNLGSVPGMIIVKKTSATGVWGVYHRSLGNTKKITLNETTAAETFTDYWNSTTPTSTQFTVGTNSSVNANAQEYVAYIFAHDDQSFGDDGDEAIIKCGSYTGSGSTGKTVSLGFEPQFMIVKSIDQSRPWVIIDNMRGMPRDGNGVRLLANDSAGEVSSASFLAPTPTGFEVTQQNTYVNVSGEDYIYIAIRRPHKPPSAGTDVFTIDPYSGSSTLPFEANFAPDLAFIKHQTTSSNWFWADRFRGENALSSDGAGADASASAYKVQFRGAFSSSWTGYIGYMFKRVPGFFDVVAAKGTSAVANYSHNLGVAPEMIIRKSRDNAYDWHVFHSSVSGNGTLNENYAWSSGSGSWTTDGTNTNMTATTFSVSASAAINSSSDNFITYLFASLSGVSKVGSYSGSSSSVDVDCGFTNGARFVLIKRTDSAGHWTLFDTNRGIVSGNDPYLRLNSTDAQNSSYDAIDPLSSGFTVNSGNGNYNTSGGTYIFLAIA